MREMICATALALAPWLWAAEMGLFDGQREIGFEIHADAQSSIALFASDDLERWWPAVPWFTGEDRVFLRQDLPEAEFFRMAEVPATHQPERPPDLGRIVCWGDSLTYGGQHGTQTDYPAELEKLLDGVDVQKRAVGGEVAESIVDRMEAYRMQPLTYPESWWQGMVTTLELTPLRASSKAGGAEPDRWSTVRRAWFYNGARCLGFVAPDYPRGPVSFPWEYDGAALDLWFDLETEEENAVTVLWIGSNDSVDQASVGDHVVAQVRRAVGLLSSSEVPYLILTPLAGDQEINWLGTERYERKEQIRAALIEAFPGHVLDIHRALVDDGLAWAGIEPTAADIEALAHDMVPTSLRVDSIHLNASGYRFVAYQVAQALVARGWATWNPQARTDP